MRTSPYWKTARWIPAIALLLAACSQPERIPPPVFLEPTPRPTIAVSTLDSTQATTSPGADIIFHNGVILTMDDARPSATALSIQGEKIVSVGDEATILAEAGPSTTMIDLSGRTLMPGFVDAHSHMFEQQDLGAVQDTLLRGGLTTSTDMYVDAPLLQRLQALDAAGDLRMRLSAYLVYNTNCGGPLDEWWRAHPPTRNPGEMFRIGGIKVFTDGGSCNAPAVTFQYANGVGQGDLYLTQPELEAALRAIDAAGYQAAVHALGDRALDVVLGAFEDLWHGVNPRRHRIEHNAVLRPDQLARYSAAQPVATIFATFPTCHKLGAEAAYKYEVPVQFRNWEWRWRDLIDANPTVHFAWHGDMPGLFPTEPLYHLFAMVTRADVAADGSICQPPDWIAHNALTVDEALHLMTTGAAYALDREAEIGSLVPGKFADLIILSDNPRTIAPLALKDLQVLMTMVGGHVEYCAEGMQAFCPSTSKAESSAAAPSTGFREDFNAANLGDGWSWIREAPDSWSLADRPGWLSLGTGDFSLLRAGGDAPLLVHPAPDGDFEMLTRVDFAPTANFHFAGLVVHQDDDHFVALGRAFCGFIPPCVGNGVYLDNDEAVLGGSTETVAAGGLPRGAIWLRLVRQDSTYTGSWSPDGETWMPVGSTTANFTPRNVGLMATTSGSGAAPVSANFDFIQVRQP